MPSNEEKLEIIKQITESKTFQKATTSSALLKYLGKCCINNTFLKEDIIDLEFFGNKGSVEKSSTRVRVSMYNLRKKLVDYYSNEGADQQWRVNIEKGQYKLSFEKQQRTSNSKRNIFSLRALSYVLLIGIIAILLFFLLIPKRVPQLWSEFLEEDKSVTLFIGDAFGIRGKTITGNDGFTRDYSINSLEQFYKLLEKKPELKNSLSASHYQYFTNMGAVASKNIAQLFSTYHKDFAIKYNSNASFETIRGGNSIYIGPLFNDNKFIGLFNSGNPYLTLHKNKLQIKDHPSLGSSQINIATSGQVADYAIVSKYPGPMGTTQFVFFSNHDMGASATIRYFTNFDSIKVFTQKYLQDKSYFTAIYKATGKERTSLDLELIKVIPF
ncbi:hypothetical protein [Saccharicrinis aurantiacus]|uniref:hypothetical protein n=1 Tax=Saccharicrinis aurantiacus TaxID=1849719 RepID=UPI00094FFCA1|nr:hypothetical protein [Saccharicrinis aurantiacus]